MRTLVNFTHVNKIKAMYERPRIRDERGSTFTFIRGLSYIAFIFFYARKIYMRTHGKITWQWKSTFSLKLLNVDVVLPIMAHSGGGGRLRPRGVPVQALVGKYMKGQGFY